MKKNKLVIIKIKKCDDDFDINKIYHQIIDCNHYFKLKEFVKIEI